MRYAVGSLTVLMLLLAVACEQSETWTEALKQTAPPNPERSEISAPRRAAAQKQAESTARSARETAGSSAESESSERRGIPAAVGDATLLVLLQGPRDCFAGAVRCYIDGRYVGQVGGDGRLQVAVRAGNRYLEVWDSRGRWEARFDVARGDTATINVRCEERRGEGEY
ncbi:MAG TPA: hypothetical protein VMX35_16500 [Acidobacteriota bacterium]|nr:hypothetical protein [Acidobacteriota bacterium]